MLSVRPLGLAGYASSEVFQAEIAWLLDSSNEDLSANLLDALFGVLPGQHAGTLPGRLGRLLGST